MMPALQVRDCPANIYEELKEYAAMHHRSMSQQILAFIEQGLRDSPVPRSKYDGELTPAEVEKRKAFFEELAARPITYDPPGTPSAVDIIREVRDSR